MDRTNQAAPPSSQSVPVLVFEAGLTSLGVLRCLGRAGIPSFLISEEHHELVGLSRWYRTLPGELPSEPRPGRLFHFLTNLNLDKAVLMPCSDYWTRVVARLPQSLRERFPASVPPQKAIETLIDKWKLAHFLDQEGLPHPRTYVADTLRDLDRVSDEELPSFFLKPTHSQEFFRCYGRKAWKITDRNQAERLLARVRHDGFSVMLQEYIPGPPTAHYFVDGFIDAQGKLLAKFGRRRLRMAPPDFGNSTYMVSVPPGEIGSALATISQMSRRIGYRGIFSAEFKHDRRDDQFKLLEVNVRPWWYIEFARRCGVDVCSLAYRDALGLSSESVSTYASGKTLAYSYYDWEAFSDPNQRSGRSLLGWVQSNLTAQHPIFVPDDPIPAVAQFFAHLGGFFGRRLGFHRPEGLLQTNTESSSRDHRLPKVSGS